MGSKFLVFKESLILVYLRMIYLMDKEKLLFQIIALTRESFNQVTIMALENLLTKNRILF